MHFRPLGTNPFSASTEFGTVHLGQCRIFFTKLYHFTNKTGHLAFIATVLETLPINISFIIPLPFVPITTRSIFWESISERILSETFFDVIIV